MLLNAFVLMTAALFAVRGSASGPFAGQEGPSSVPEESRLVVFWNLENFFDWKDSGTGESDAEFSSAGARHWTRKRFYAKCTGVSKVLLMIADRCGRLPDAACFAEVENSFVVRQLVYSTALSKLDYKVLHCDSPDHRGIDCALVYRKSTMHLRRWSSKHIYGRSGEVLPTRDILLAEFDGFDILVNHHPSKVGGGGKSDRRSLAMSRMKELCDSLESEGHGRILCIGDFNEDLWHRKDSRGTIKYNGSWEKIDGCFPRGLEVEESVFEDASLLTGDAAFGGFKPRRTYSGPRYLGGVSDHLPIVAEVRRPILQSSFPDCR